MKIKPSLELGLIASLLVILSVIACKKDSDTPGDTDVQTAQDNTLAESNYDDATIFVDLSATHGSSISFRQAQQGNQREESLLGGCTTITLDTVSATRTITVDFGASNCLCLDGRNRRGKIIATYTGKYREAGMVLNISFNNYFVNDHQIKGTHKVTNLGNNNAGNLVYKVEVNGQIVKANNGGTINWSSTRLREWIAGASTPLNFADDAYSITGSATGTTAAGEAYTITITQALVRKMTCRWFESGKVEVAPSGKLTRTLDYGSSGCDANATVTIAGQSFPVVLP
jgi:hypothetical protein